MSRRGGVVVFGAALMLAAACGADPDARATDATDGASSTRIVDRAVTVASALRASPAATDSVLAAYTLTREAFDSLMYQIAADADLARTYAEAMR